MDRDRLAAALETRFHGTDRSYSVVSRQARDLDNAGYLETDLGVELTAETVVSNLADAPAEFSVAERWNWWMGALDLSHGEYRRFQVREDLDER